LSEIPTSWSGRKEIQSKFPKSEEQAALLRRSPQVIYILQKGDCNLTLEEPADRALTKWSSSMSSASDTSSPGGSVGGHNLTSESTRAE
jgi:hypothetical protein